MFGLPKLPGYFFKDWTNNNHKLSHTLDIRNGYYVSKLNLRGKGDLLLDTQSVKFTPPGQVLNYDPTLVYGRSKGKIYPPFVPHYVQYEGKCLTFRAFFKQSIHESPIEHFRVRNVNIIYFLGDGTITVMEPKTLNSGMEQGRLVKRAKIPKNIQGDFLHWKDLQVGKDISIHGIVYHTVSCDQFTKEFMASQGIIMADPETMPQDEYTVQRKRMVFKPASKTPAAGDKMRRFLEYDNKILKFKAIWDDRESLYGELRKFDVLYFLFDDTISLKEKYPPNSGRDPIPQLLKKMKLPKLYTDTPVTHPSCCMELTEAEIKEFYQPKDLLVGTTIFVLGRDLLLYDCDEFTRNYYKKALGIEQKPPIVFKIPEKPPPARLVAPYDGLGSLEDSIQNTFTCMPKPPKKDVIKMITNHNKYLKYAMRMVTVHPEDTIRRFIMSHSLADGSCKIWEPPIKNSGIIGGRYLRNSMLVKPGSDPLNPTYYSPIDFFIGAKVDIFGQRFEILGADLYVYRYMQVNSDKFPCEVIENMRNYMFNKGYLKDDIEDQMKDNQEIEKKIERDAIGRDLVYTAKEMERCLEKAKESVIDPEREERLLQKFQDEYEESLKHTSSVPGHGLSPINTTCALPVVDKVQSTYEEECEELTDGSQFTPKKILKPHDVRRKYYRKVLGEQKEICKKDPFEVCAEPIEGESNRKENQAPRINPLIVVPPEFAPGECPVNYTVIQGAPCAKDVMNLNEWKNLKTTCACSQYCS